MKLRKKHLVAGICLCWTTASHGQARPAVVELFTSEGCSSCPPAEAYLGELVDRQNVLALAFHVQYWDDLGWRDRFGLPQAVERQRAYANALRLSTVYTPQVVIDGRHDYVGNDRVSIDKALASHRDGVAIALSAENGQIFIDLGTSDAVAPSDVELVSYQRAAVSSIGRGENAGRTIKEFNVVRDLRHLGRWDGKRQRFQARRDSLPRDATDVAVLIQTPLSGPIVGAATMSLR